MEGFTQMKFDTRDELVKSVSALTVQTVRDTRILIQNCREKPKDVMNRHEAYGIASEHYAKIAHMTKAIKEDLGGILVTLADPNATAIDAVAAMKNSVEASVSIILMAAADMARTLDNLYSAETSNSYGTDLTPMDEILEGTYEDADPYPDQTEE